MPSSGDRIPVNPDETVLKRLLEQAKTIAVIGLSSDSARPSHRVAAYLQSVGYKIVPIHPSGSEPGTTVLGERVYPTLGDVPPGLSVDIVDVFRRSSEVVPHAAEAVVAGARCLWLQDGVVNAKAARVASEAGLVVVQDDCMLRRHRQLLRAT